MAKNASTDRLLPQNVRSIDKIVRAAGGSLEKVTEYRIASARGLVLHLMPTGRATWYAHYDVSEGKRRRRRKLKLGRYDEMSLATAVAQAEEVRSAVRNGDDPVFDVQANREALTFGELCEFRLREGSALRPRTISDYRYLLETNILPELRDLPVAKIDRQRVIKLLDGISARGATRQADIAKAVVSSVFSFGLDRGLVSDNPVRGLKNWHNYQPRDVVLAAAQIRAIWRSIDDGNAAMSEPIRQIVKLALLTGQRRAEIAGLRRVDITLGGDRPVFVITRERAKNATRHSVPLSGSARRLLEKALLNGKDQPFVFPGRHGHPIQPGSVTKAFVRTRKKLEEVGFQVHDLRRTVASLLASYGVPRDVREYVFNHSNSHKRSVTEGVYTWYDYDAEKRAALDLWTDALTCIVDEQDVEIDDYYSRLAKFKSSSKVRVV